MGVRWGCDYIRFGLLDDVKKGVHDGYLGRGKGVPKWCLEQDTWLEGHICVIVRVSCSSSLVQAHCLQFLFYWAILGGG